MQRFRQCLIGAACLTVGAGATALWAQEKPKNTNPTAAAAPQEMSAEEKAMWEAMEKYRAVGDNHKLLAEYTAGEWTFVNKMWMGPEATESKGTASTKPILGGRYFQATVKGEFNGEQFEGVAVTGYDNHKKKFVNSWVDNFGTGIMMSEGTYDPGTKTFTYTCSMDCPMDSSPVKIREVIRIIDKNKHVMEWYETRAGKENKTMEITYTRKGA